MTQGEPTEARHYSGQTKPLARAARDADTLNTLDTIEGIPGAVMSISSQMRLDRANAAIDALTVGEFLELVHRRIAPVSDPEAFDAIKTLGLDLVRIVEARAAEVEAQDGRA